MCTYLQVCVILYQLFAYREAHFVYRWLTMEKFIF